MASRTMLIAAFFVFAMGESILVQSADDTVVITTRYGSVRGVIRRFQGINKPIKTVNKFLGIPYAAPPVNELRFKPPKPVSTWQPSTYDASYYRSICTQPSDYNILFWPNFSHPESEDCLYLNVYTPHHNGSFGAITVPMYIILLSHHIDNVTYQSVYTSVDIASGFASVFTLTAIGLERLYAFCRPLYRVHVLTDLKCLLMIGMVWILSFAITILHLLYKFHAISFDVFFYVMMSSLSVCLLVICASYLGIWIRVKFYFTSQGRASGSDKKVARMLLTITLTFVLTWLPFHLLNIINFFCDFCLTTKLPHNALFFCKLLHYANSFINPIIYSFQMPEFRIALGRKLCKETFVVVEETPKIEEIPLDNIGGAEEL